MKRKRMALFLVMALAVTSVNGMMTTTVCAADLVSEPVVETVGQESEEVEVIENSEVEEAEESTTTEANVDIDITDEAVMENIEEADGIESAGDTDAKKMELISGETDAETASVMETEKSVVPDEGITKLDENYVYTVDITAAGDCKWFTFTPEEDGKYKFYSTGDICTFGYFFDRKDYYGKLEQYKGDYFHYSDSDDSMGLENNFEFVRELQAGKTYYYCVGMSDNAAGYFDVIFRKVNEIKSIHATLNRRKIEAGIENGLSATLQYVLADGSVKTAELNVNDGHVSDREVLDEGTTDIKIIDSEGNENAYAYGTVLEKGKYKVIFSVGNVQSKALEFEAADVEDAGAYYGEVKEGENPGTKVPANGRSFYKFIPSETQKYIFENCERLWIYHRNKDGSLEEVGDGYWNRPLMQKKEEYYFRLMDIEESNLKIYREPSLTSILFTPYSTEVYEPVVGFYDRQIRGNLVFSYDNKDPEEIENIDLLNGWSNHYLNKIETVIEDENGKKVSADAGLSAGKYRVHLRCGDIESEPYTLTVIPFEYDKLPQLKTGTNKITTERWYAFTPAVTESYDISIDNDKYSVNWYYMDENGEIQSCYADDWKEMELDKNKKYLIYLYYPNSYGQAEAIHYIISKSGDCRWKETKVTVATCTEDGEIKEICTVHGEMRRKIIRKSGHELGNRQIIRAATCGAAGESARICSRCKGKFEKQTIKADGKHKYGSWKTKKDATALTEGQKECICTVCKKAKQTQKIAKLKATLKLSVAAKKTLSLKLKRSYKVSVQMTKGDRVVSWKSSNSKAVTVDKYGKITGKQAGKTAKITVKLKSGLTTWFNVKVQKTDVATTSLKLKNASTGKYMANSVTLKRKQILKVTPVIAPVTSTQKVTYTTSNEKVATVASNGQITAKARGTAYITAKSGNKNVKIKITVK